MKIAYVDCFSGISGDMFVAAFLDAGLRIEELKAVLDGLQLAGWKISAEKTKRGSLAATRFIVKVEVEQAERHLSQILEIIERSTLPAPVKENSSRVFVKLAEAEARAHGIEPAAVHFHEVGAVDSIIDIVGAASCLYLAGIEQLFASTLSVGKGGTQSRHGAIPLPAPATSFLLLGHSVRILDIESELVTPTGAAIVSTLARQEKAPVPIRLESVGCGAGSRECAGLPNVLRVFIGVYDAQAVATGLVDVIETTIDDMNPEIYGFLCDRLFEIGALDVFMTPVQMKKGRPGILLTVLSEPGVSRELGEEILRQTTTLGLRISTQSRMELARSVHEVLTPYGTIRVKVPLAFPGKVSPEYEDCSRAAKTHGVPILAVYQAARMAWQDRTSADA